MTTTLDERFLAEQQRRENFRVTGAVGPRRLRRELRAIYVFARTVDDIGDELDGDRSAALERLSADVERLYIGAPPRHPAVRGLAPVVAEDRLPRAPLDALIEANRRDQVQTSYGTWSDLLDYCRYSAEPVGELVLHLLGAATPDRLSTSAKVCAALQIIEHCQDVAEDQRRGRVYLPQEDLERFRCTVDDLAKVPTPTRVRGLVSYELGRAEALLDEGAELVGSLRGWGRLLVAGYVAGGRAAAGELRRDRFASLDGRSSPRPVRRAVLTAGTWMRGC